MIATKPTTTKTSLAVPGAVAGGEQADPGEQQHDHPRVDQVAVDLLDPGQDRRRRARDTAARPRRRTRSRRSARTPAPPRGCAGTARSCSRGRRSSARGIGENPISQRRRSSSAAQSPVAAAIGLGEAGGGEGGGDLVELGGQQARADEGRDRGARARCELAELPDSTRRAAAGSARSCWRRRSGPSSGRRSRRLMRSQLELDVVGRRRWRPPPPAPAARGRSRGPGPSRASRRRSRGRRSRCRGRSAGRAPRPPPPARAGTRGRGGSSGGRRCRRPGRGRRRRRSRPRAAAPRTAAARAARRPAAACGSRASGRPSRRGSRWR